MAANQSPADDHRRRRRERLKVVAIPVLGIALAAILLWPASPQPPSPQSRPAASADRSTAARAVSTAATAAVAAVNPSAAPPAASALSDGADEARWPKLDLEHLSAANPFAKKPAAEAAEPIRAAETAETSAAIEPSGTPGPPEALTLPPAIAAWPLNVPRSEAAARGPDAATAAPIDYSTIGEVKAIIHGEAGNLALLDDQRLVRTGDRLPGGFRVVAINDDQLLVAADREGSEP